MLNPPQNFQDSATVRIHALAQKKRAQGERVYNLSAGEPILNTGHFYKEIVDKILDEGKTLYPPAAGLPQLREKAAEWMNQNNRTDYTAKNTLVTPGGKFGIYLVIKSLLAEGDEVLISSPHYLSYPSMLELIGAKAVLVAGKPENDWKITVEDLKKHCTKKTKMLILNNGSNPTGVLYNDEEIAEFLEFAEKNDIWILSDEVYSGLVYDGLIYPSCATPLRTRNRVVIIQSASKNFGMTGWRLGFVFGPAELVKSCIALQSQILTSTSIVSQWAGLTALSKVGEITSFIREEMQKRRDALFGGLEKGLGIKLQKPLSSLYAFLPISIFTKEKISDVEFCELLLKDIGLAAVPGSPFGREDYIRFSFGEKIEELEEAVKVLCNYCKKLR